ncbi:protein of unknown function [Caminicella sporogenes DSM 14501]|uniref:DUF3870 domain-containing protein n=1 Tax=Caminicella sporogenes DSM 14501 TaxID=1121266 RepID=A0A1M6QRN7_9FIRM|nr:DUF3870 domain-containing protein [Caminicella sporogenes]RKD20935.1 hypothetical protein BET04_08900 [Caminicella sporogenes]WIF95657.1 DUF3870 domain-containing protein [Caminicella sporogenes]SHK22952.1 protein of unknown function [Caminicella sporogenes DSM 14501]
MEPYEIFITGYAKLPKGITATELYHVIAVGLIVDKYTGKILDVDCSLVTRVAKQFIKNLVVGKNLKDFDSIQNDLKNHYYGSAKKALISAFKTCHEKYKQIMESNKNYIDIDD